MTQRRAGTGRPLPRGTGAGLARPRLARLPGSPGPWGPAPGTARRGSPYPTGDPQGKRRLPGEPLPDSGPHKGSPCFPLPFSHSHFSTGPPQPPPSSQHFSLPGAEVIRRDWKFLQDLVHWGAVMMLRGILGSISRKQPQLATSLPLTVLGLRALWPLHHI